MIRDTKPLQIVPCDGCRAEGRIDQVLDEMFREVRDSTFWLITSMVDQTRRERGDPTHSDMRVYPFERDFNTILTVDEGDLSTRLIDESRINGARVVVIAYLWGGESTAPRTPTWKRSFAVWQRRGG